MSNPIDFTKFKYSKKSGLVKCPVCGKVGRPQGNTIIHVGRYKIVPIPNLQPIEKCEMKGDQAK